MKNSVNWFEIPVVDMPRAQAFYEAVMNVKLVGRDFMGSPMAIFAAEGVAGALVKVPNRKPNADGALVYLNAGTELDAVLSRIEKAGGKIVLPRTEIGPLGSMAVMADTEGNQVGLHQEA